MPDTQFSQGVLDALLAAAAIGGDRSGFPAGAGDDPLDGPGQLRGIGGVPRLHVVVHDDTVVGGHDLGLATERTLAGHAAHHLRRRRTLQDERHRDTYTSRFAAQGYYFAGDGAKHDADGALWLLGRVDDVMNVSGHRISTTEVESAPPSPRPPSLAPPTR